MDKYRHARKRRIIEQMTRVKTFEKDFYYGQV